MMTSIQFYYYLITLTKIYCQKILYNLNQLPREGTSISYGDYLLPITSSCFQNENVSTSDSTNQSELDQQVQKGVDFDIVFIQGQDSHPLRTWWMSREHKKLWPTELLLNDLKQAGHNPRIILVRYESKRLEQEHAIQNIPDHDFQSLSSGIYQDLKKAGVGERPFIIVPYSLGGVVTRQTLLQHPDLFSNLQGLQIIASPLVKSDMRQQLNEDLKGFIPVLNNMMAHAEAIDNSEYVTHFLQEALSREIPYRILIEDKKTYLRLIGKDYFYVPFECGVLEPHLPETFAIMKGKNHGNVQQAIDRNDPTYQEISSFIFKCIQRMNLPKLQETPKA